MTEDEASTVLTVAAAFDLRKVGKADSIAWSQALQRIGFAEARDAVVAHYTTSRERIMPSDVLHLVLANRRRIMAAAGPPNYPPALGQQGERAWRLAWRDALLAGADPTQAERVADHRLSITRPTAPEISAPQQVRAAIDRFTAARKATR
jgi:hypothetical protein